VAGTVVTVVVPLVGGVGAVVVEALGVVVGPGAVATLDGAVGPVTAPAQAVRAKSSSVRRRTLRRFMAGGIRLAVMSPPQVGIKPTLEDQVLNS
jgi:hypothetical protein